MNQVNICATLTLSPHACHPPSDILSISIYTQSWYLTCAHCLSIIHRSCCRGWGRESHCWRSGCECCKSRSRCTSRTGRGQLVRAPCMQTMFLESYRMYSDLGVWVWSGVKAVLVSIPMSCLEDFWSKNCRCCASGCTKRGLCFNCGTLWNDGWGMQLFSNGICLACTFSMALLFPQPFAHTNTLLLAHFDWTSFSLKLNSKLLNGRSEKASQILACWVEEVETEPWKRSEVMHQATWVWWERSILVWMQNHLVLRSFMCYVH